MDRQKQIDLIRKRNSELSKQLDDLKFKLEFDTQLNMEGYKSAKELINDLEKIRADWYKNLKEIEGYKTQYSLLIHDLKAMKKIMNRMGFAIPVHKRIILWLNKRLNFRHFKNENIQGV